MKRIYTFLLLLAITALCLKAQLPINVYEDTLQFGSSVAPGITVNIPEADYDKALRSWIREQESGTKSKVVTENNGMSIFGANIKDISATPVNIYSTLVKQESELLLSVAFELRKDEYISMNTGEGDFAKAKAYLFNFSKNQYLDFAGEELKAEQAKLRSIEKDLSSLQSRESRLSKSLGKNNRTVVRERERLIGLNNDLTTASAAIAEHSSQLGTMLPGAERDEKEKYIKSLEKDKKKLQRSIRSSENRMKKASSAIDKANRDLPRNDRTQERIKEQLSAQQAVVQTYTEKLNRIRAYK
ncbi:MAG: hypothetical protein K0B05_01340 [Bacteroidales bacterium]|nr:hypothetical protein [Bacteroidales bacterium]